MVDRDAPRRADLVLAAVAAADRAALVVLGLQHRRAASWWISRASSGWPSLRISGSTATLTGASRGCSRSSGPRLALDLLLVVGVDEERERRAVGAGGGLDHVRHVALAALRVEVLERLARVLGVPAQVEVAAVGDPLELRPADREEVLDVAGLRGVVRELVGVVRAQPQMALRAARARGTSRRRSAVQYSNHSRRLGRRHEELHLHLLELARAEDEVARRDLVAKRLADLGDAERRLLARELRARS